MWLFKAIVALLTAAIALGGCTVEPLYGDRTRASASTGAEQASVREALAGIEVAEVKTRVAQQVRNALLFAMKGGRQSAEDRYRLILTVTSADSGVAVETGALAATAAQVRVLTSYTLTDKTTGQIVTSGKRIALASYDRTSQRFANARAAREAENRAARDVALQVRLALSQALAGA